MSQWEVVGGADKGGVLVRAGQDTKSPELPKRLSYGARVLELELHGDRLHYQRLTGTGPDIGWVSVRLKGKDLLVRSGARKGKLQDDDDDDALDFLPPSSRVQDNLVQPKSTNSQHYSISPATSAADRERRANTRQALLQQMEAMPYLRQQFEAQIAALDAEDAREQSANNPTKLHEIATGAALGAPSTPQQPRPAARKSDAPASSAGREAFKVAQVDVVSDTRNEAQDDDVVPSMDDLLAKVEHAMAVEEEPSKPPTIEDMLAMLDKDEKEEQEFEAAVEERDNFFKLSSLEGTAVSRMAIIDPLAGLNADTLGYSTQFSYSNVKVLGDQCLQRAMPVIRQRQQEKLAANAKSYSEVDSTLLLGAASAESLHVPAASSSREPTVKPQAAAEKMAAKGTAATEERAAEEKTAAENRAAEEKTAAEKRAAEEKVAAEKRATEETAAAEKRAAEEKAAAEKRAAEEKAAAEKRAAEAEVARPSWLQEARGALLALKQSDLRKRARAAGCDENSMDEADDAEDTKAVLLELILCRLESLRTELLALKQSDLRKRARAAGCDEDSMDKADDAEDTKSALMELILAQITRA